MAGALAPRPCFMRAHFCNPFRLLPPFLPRNPKGTLWGPNFPTLFLPPSGKSATVAVLAVKTAKPQDFFQESAYKQQIAASSVQNGEDLGCIGRDAAC